MRADQITINQDGGVTVSFDTFPIELPKPLDRLLVRHLATRGQASYASRPDRWLFPGGHPGKHLATENIRSQLVQRGIQPGTARNAAMYQLAAEIPTPILAEMLGLSPNTAVRWAALAARDWSQYAALRQTRGHDVTSSPPRPDLAQHQQHSTSDPAEPTMVRAPGHLSPGRGAAR